jgi:hypothetical protein
MTGLRFHERPHGQIIDGDVSDPASANSGRMISSPKARIPASERHADASITPPREMIDSRHIGCFDPISCLVCVR